MTGSLTAVPAAQKPVTGWEALLASRQSCALLATLRAGLRGSRVIQGDSAGRAEAVRPHRGAGTRPLVSVALFRGNLAGGRAGARVRSLCDLSPGDRPSGWRRDPALPQSMGFSDF